MVTMPAMVATVMPAMTPVAVVVPTILHVVVAIAVLHSRGLRPNRRGAQKQNASYQK